MGGKIGGAPITPGKPRTSIRDREDRAEIEFELATGKSVRAVANKYGVHEGALYKWRKKLPPQLRQAYVGHLLKPGVDLEKLRVEESEGLLQNLATQRARLLIMQDQAMEDGNAQAVATVAGRIQENLRIVGQYLGELQQHSTRTTVSVLVSPEYLQLRNALLRALGPFPEARRAVAAALHEIENGGAPGMPQPPMIDVTPALTAPT
jgi:transposase-like protein